MNKQSFYMIMMGIVFSISFELQAQVYYSGCTPTSSKQASAIGLNCTSTGNQSFASGNYATASGNYSLALGNFVQATATNAFTLGSGTSTSGYLSNATASSFLLGFSNTPVLFAQLSAGTPRVGIGTKTPKFALDVNGEANAKSVYTNNLYFPGTELRIGKYVDGIITAPPDDPRGVVDVMTLKDDGKVGIGTRSPNARLDVAGDINGYSLNLAADGKMRKLELTGKAPYHPDPNNPFVQPVHYLQLGTKGLISGFATDYILGNNLAVDNMENYIRIQQGPVSGICLNGYDEKIYFLTAPTGPAGSAISPSSVCIHKGKLGIGTNSPNQELYVNGSAYISSKMGIGVSPQHPLHVNGNSYITGNVGIGSAPSATYKLGVNGTIGCKEIVVTNSGWADYVFESDYALRSLGELESFILENKRLPEVPSAAQVEEDGVGLFEMNTLLLKKVEELTLYILEQNKRIEALEKATETK